MNEIQESTFMKTQDSQVKERITKNLEHAL